jgi:uncharacterized membrane protein
MPADPAARVAARPDVRGASGWLPRTILVLSVLGLLVAGYLTVEHYTSATTLACPETGAINCAKVTTSSYAAIAGIPVAVLGLLFFAAMNALCLPAAWRSPQPVLRWVRLGWATTGVGFVLYLIWAELFRVNAICLWCTAVHLLTLLLFALITVAQALGGPADESP